MRNRGCAWNFHVSLGVFDVSVGVFNVSIGVFNMSVGVCERLRAPAVLVMERVSGQRSVDGVLGEQILGGDSVGTPSWRFWD